MAPDLYQLVDMRQPEADGLMLYIEIDEQGRHVLPLEEYDGQCDACPSEAELVEADGGVSAKDRQTFGLAGRRCTTLLCQKHLIAQETHLGFKNGGGA